MVEEAPLEHWIQRYAQHRRDRSLEHGSFDAKDSAKPTNDGDEDTMVEVAGSTDPCWLGLLRLQHFLVMERPVLLLDLNQQQQLHRSRERAVRALDSLMAALVKDNCAEDETQPRRSRTSTEWARLRGHCPKLRDVLQFYLSKAPVESRPSNLASFQEFLVSLESDDDSATDPREEVVHSVGNVDADVLSFLMHVKSFLLQAIGEQAYRREKEQHGAPSSASFFPDEMDEPSTRTLQDWVQVVASCSSELSDSSTSKLPIGTMAWMKGDNASVLGRLAQRTAEHSTNARASLQQCRDRAVADRDAARKHATDMERRWNDLVQEMSDLRRQVEERLDGVLREGDAARASPRAPPLLTTGRPDDSDPTADDVVSSPGARVAFVRISDEALQSPTLQDRQRARSRPDAGAPSPF